jgi:septal ring factor EnvC (AmiA/AmiB activator)
MKSKKNRPLPSKPISKNKPPDSQFQSEIEALKNENLKLQRQIFKLKAEQVSLNNKITILEENTNERCVHETPPYECLVKAQQILEKQIQEYEK